MANSKTGRKRFALYPDRFRISRIWSGYPVFTNPKYPVFYSPNPHPLRPWRPSPNQSRVNDLLSAHTTPPPPSSRPDEEQNEDGDMESDPDIMNMKMSCSLLYLLIKMLVFVWDFCFILYVEQIKLFVYEILSFALLCVNCGRVVAVNLFNVLSLCVGLRVVVDLWGC